ncbi:MULTISPECIES: hypothetical protein [Sphingomonas]|uniref:Uncharacterized protein n=1 Tax=Sphingomonas kyungheensis TaxID=1069987 RepID=A0ABU8H1U8_9SPHN|nr:hypothetical protein [Sphingomonas sp. RIT328]EZP50369.1 hypothetical protein BW41_03159 [Sphingomonas sp. RIT328]
MTDPDTAADQPDDAREPQAPDESNDTEESGAGYGNHGDVPGGA